MDETTLSEAPKRRSGIAPRELMHSITSPLLLLALDVCHLSRPETLPHGRERRPGLDGLQLTIVTDQHELGVLRQDDMDEPRHLYRTSVQGDLPA